MRNRRDTYRAVHPTAMAGDDEPPQIHNPPLPGQWDRIVVDRATAPFDARPTTARVPPDTVCDGWATADLTVRMASTRGDSHRHSGTPRQDHAEMTLHPGTGTVILAVLDGVSSAHLSHQGAEAAARTAMAAVWRMLEQRDEIDWYAVLVAAAGALVNHPLHGRRPGETEADVERRLATTIVTGIVRPTPAGPKATLVRVGDSAAWLLRPDGVYVPLFDGKHGAGQTIVSAVEPLPRLPQRVEPVEVLISHGCVLLVATDGIGDPLGDGTGLVGELFTQVLADPPPPLGLAHAVDFSRETFDDDRTLIGVWPGPTRPGAGRPTNER